MKISNFGNIVKDSKKNYLKENYLSSEYEWGFELEGCIKSSLSWDLVCNYEFLEPLICDYEEQYKEGNISKETYEVCEKLYNALMEDKPTEEIMKYLNDDNFNDEIWDITSFDLRNLQNGLIHSEYEEVHDLIYEVFKKYITNGNYGKMSDDGSIKEDEEYDYTFEYATPHMPFKPSVIEDMIKFFKELDKTNFYVNDTCGFHIHLSYPDINKNDLIWVLCCLALDVNKLNLISYLERSGIKLFNNVNDENQYSSIEMMEFINEEIKQKDWVELGFTLQKAKEGVFRIHPQGTLEWRGPRNFLTSSEKKLDVKNLYDLFKNLYKLTQFISSCLNKKFIEYDGKKIFRNEILQNVLSQPAGIATNKFNSPIDKKTFGKYSEFYIEAMRNGFNEEYLREYLTDIKKIIGFVNYLKLLIAEKDNKNKPIMGNLTFEKLYNYFNKLKKKNLLYPYKEQILDCLEINDPLEYK